MALIINAYSTSFLIFKSVVKFWFWVFILPLSLNYSHLWNNQIILLMLLWGIGLGQQEYLSFKNDVNNSDDKNRDWTQGFIAFSTYITTFFSLIDFAYFKTAQIFYSTITYIGLFMLLFGFILRGWSLFILGNHFSKKAQESSGNHKLVIRGPFTLIRHPSYSGAILFVIGQTLFLNSMIGFLLAICIIPYSYIQRISFEEQYLASNKNLNYKAYIKRTKKLIPFIY